MRYALVPVATMTNTAVTTYATNSTITFEMDPLEVVDFGFGIKAWRSVRTGYISGVDYGDGKYVRAADVLRLAELKTLGRFAVDEYGGALRKLAES